MKPHTYEKAFEELEKIVASLEGDDVPIDTLAEKIKNATELIQFCKTKLRSTEEEFQKAIEKLS
ncbi:MAG: exodeoxyribonuclease VII small subunit [Bacteroidia bacterium]